MGAKTAANLQKLPFRRRERLEPGVSQRRICPPRKQFHTEQTTLLERQIDIMMVQQWARPHLDQGCLVLHSYPLFNLTLFQDSKDGLDRSVGSFSLGPLVHLPSVATLPKSPSVCFLLLIFLFYLVYRGRVAEPGFLEAQIVTSISVTIFGKLRLWNLEV